MPAKPPSLDFLSFDASSDTGGVHTFDAMASTSRERHPAVLAEVDQVLAWAERRFPDGPGDLDEGASWCHDLQVMPEGDWVTVNLSLSGTPAFGEAFARAFAGAIGQGED
ncbi:hypothetical protein [Aquabacterium sp. UBA2148]|uniref:hypothetical protein n=1 Tax=Aquabacterium sp. UBA2148 TaxID=1946042 RepID=UPI002579E8E0|nr:hypothetical protein [Aquabacterium sp. UBA2148]